MNTQENRQDANSESAVPGHGDGNSEREGEDGRSGRSDLEAENTSAGKAAGAGEGIEPSKTSSSKGGPKKVRETVSQRMKRVISARGLSVNQNATSSTQAQASPLGDTNVERSLSDGAEMSPSHVPSLESLCMKQIISNSSRLRTGAMDLVPDYIRLQIMEAIHKRNQMVLYGETLQALVCGTYFAEINLRNSSNLRDADLQAIAPWLRKTKVLDLSNTPYITDEGMAPALSQCLELESLSMERMTSLIGNDVFVDEEVEVEGEGDLHGTTSGLAALELSEEMEYQWKDISEVMAQLTRLSTLGCSTMTEDALASVCKSAVSLRDLNLSWCQQITDDAFAELQPTSLTKLNMSFNPRLTDFSVKCVARKCPQLESLDIAGCPLLSDAGMRSVAARLELLKTVNISFLERITDASVETLAIGCPLLVSLDCEQTQIGDKSLKALTDYSKDLKSLNVAFCHNLTEGAIMGCWSHCKLHTLNVTQCRQVSMQTRFWLMAKANRSKGPVAGAQGAPEGAGQLSTGGPQAHCQQHTAEEQAPAQPSPGTAGQPLNMTDGGIEGMRSSLATY